MLGYFIKRSLLLLLLPVFMILTMGALCGVNAQAVDESAPLRMISLRTAGDDNRVRMIAVFSAKPDYDIMMLGRPPRLILNLPKTEFFRPADQVETRGIINDVRYGMISEDRARIILGMKSSFKVEKIDIEPLQNNIWQLVVDVVKVSDRAFSKSLADVYKAEPKKPETKMPHITHGLIKDDRFTVVVDAGHGEFDSGAQGIGGVLEKNVTLAFARVLRAKLEEKSHLKVVMTRDDDIFLRLSERVKVARDHGADLFISVHADSIHMPEIRGATVYTISDKASDKIAKAVAENENKADLLDGLPPDEPPEVTDILIDLTRRETDTFSAKFADNVIVSLKKGKIRLIKNPHRHAGFMVLRAPDIPSVLIELGYLSNPADEKLIVNPEWQARMADLVASAVENYAATRRPDKNKKN